MSDGKQYGKIKIRPCDLVDEHGACWSKDQIIELCDKHGVGYEDEVRLEKMVYAALGSDRADIDKLLDVDFLLTDTLKPAWHSDLYSWLDGYERDELCNCGCGYIYYTNRTLLVAYKAFLLQRPRG